MLRRCDSDRQVTLPPVSHAINSTAFRPFPYGLQSASKRSTGTAVGPFALQTNDRLRKGNCEDRFSRCDGTWLSIPFMARNG